MDIAHVSIVKNNVQELRNLRIYVKDGAKSGAVIFYFNNEEEQRHVLNEKMST